MPHNVKSDAPFISVIIPVFNDAQRLEKCLDSLENQTFPKDRYEIIIVDNASTVDLKGLVNRYKNCHYLYEAKPGSYAARNKGLSSATGEIIAFTDSDCIPATDWIEKGVLALLEHPECGFIGGAIRLFYNNPDYLTGVEIYESLKGFPQQHYIERENFGATANVFTYRKVIDTVGLFNDKLKSGGDSEWGKRVASAGYQLVYANEVEVGHPARSTYLECYRKTVRVMGGLPAFRNASLTPIENFKRLLRGLLIPPVSRVRKILAEASEKTVMERIRLTMVIIFIHYIWVFEGARLHSKNRVIS